MKIAVTTAGDSMEAPFESRFGRAPKFLIYNTEEQSFQVIDNAQNMNAAQGAGIQAAQNVSAAGATALITGHCGPKAFRVLKEAGIEVHLSEAETVAEAIKQYEAGQLKKAASPDVEGHWS